ncbi:hypothetical protein BUALT_Bualt01G0081600 [Buddleja alternifolia]|uniref:Uncharacterized protein n=1 Tax=Buddleja alternifolia TaxID=168488 RepID=A0AAV6YC03_9LAMI|nr:hypothetical protein BUALT_Bualt01G0081600 [Buddleja alternifolia]
MGFELDNHYEPNSTPKLSLSKLPCKPREPLHMLTPPLRPSVSIPFQWEEAPGKPRSTAAPPPQPATPPSSKNKAARCLELPPRLLHDDAKITIMPSPTTVLDGPYVGRSLSLACTFSFRKGMVTGREDGVRPGKRGSGGNLGSGRWGSFREEGKFVRGSSDFSHSLGDIFKIDKNVKITRVRRRRSFFSLSTINSNLLGDIYASFKQAVPWRRR